MAAVAVTARRACMIADPKLDEGVERPTGVLEQ
jgi:hypothetical protein